MKQNIGFIGLGSLGTPIALNLAEGTRKLFVYNRTHSKTDVLKAKGATVCESVSTLAKQCNVVFTIVSDDAALKNICEGEDGLLNNLQETSIHVSMSTILPKTAEELSAMHAQWGQHYIAAPVFGRPEAAAQKKLNFCISGEPALRAEIELLLRAAGGMNIFDFGESKTAANIVKLCGNFLIASALEAIGESVHFANASGIDANKMWEMFSQTLFNTPLYHNYSKIILNQKFEPAAFAMKLGLKDMNLVLAQAAIAQQQMPLATLLQTNMQRIVESGKDKIDWSAVSTSASPA